MDKRMQKCLVLAVLVMVLALSQETWAATSSGSGFYLENFAVKLFSMCKNVVVPCLLLAIVAFAAGNIAFGWVQMGPGLARLLLAGAILAGGIEAVLVMVGGQVATALVLP